MPKKITKTTRFAMSSLDKAIIERSYNPQRRDFDIGIWMSGYFGGQVFPYQYYFYHAPQKYKMLIAGIRTGKSRLASMAQLHFAQFHQKARLLNTSISSEQAKIVYYNCLEYCQNPNFAHWVEYASSSPYPIIRLVNGSELWFRSVGYDAELIRGFEFDFINVDEAAYITREHAITTLQGRLLGINPYTNMARAGWLWMISSPKGRGWLYERWKKGDPAFPGANTKTYLSLRATTFDNPLLDRQQLQDTLEDMSEVMRLQELYGLFLEDSDVLFPLTMVMDACNDKEREVRWLCDQIRFYNAAHKDEYKALYGNNLALPPGHLQAISEDIEHYECEPQPGHHYVASWDLGKKTTSKGRNATVGMVWDVTHEPWIMVGYWYNEHMGYVDAKANIEAWHEKYSTRGCTCSTVIDATGKGDVLQEFIEREKTINDLEGIVYSGANKPYLLQAGKIAIERGLVRFPFIKKMVNQLSQYIPDDKEIAQDIVMAFCQAMYRARELTRITEVKITSGQQHASVRSSNPLRDARARRDPRYVEGRLARRTMRQHINGNTPASAARKRTG